MYFNPGMSNTTRKTVYENNSELIYTSKYKAEIWHALRYCTKKSECSKPNTTTLLLLKFAVDKLVNNKYASSDHSTNRLATKRGFVI